MSKRTVDHLITALLAVLIACYWGLMLWVGSGESIPKLGALLAGDLAPLEYGQ